MAFKAFKNLECGEMFKHLDYLWVKTPVMEVDDVIFNAFTPSDDPNITKDDKLKVYKMDDATLVNLNTGCDPERIRHFKELFAQAKR